MERRSVRAFLKVIEPPMALRVLKRPSNRFLFVLNTQNKSIIKKKKSTYISVTASPTPQNLASSSMPSSLITVLSTSKQTASALLKSSFVCDSVVIMLGNYIKKKMQSGETNFTAADAHCVCVCLSVCVGGGVIVISRVPCCIC